METSNNNISIVTAPIDIPPPNLKKTKKFMTAYWGIQLNSNNILDIPLVATLLRENSHMKKNEKFHITLLYVGKKEDVRENIYIPIEHKNCQIVIDRIGFSKKAIAIGVKSIKFIEDDEYTVSDDVPTFAIQHHITVALSDGTKAVDSVKTLLGEGKIIRLNKNIAIRGRLTRFLF